MSFIRKVGRFQRQIMKLTGILPIKGKSYLQHFLFIFNSFNVASLLVYLCWESFKLANVWHGITSFTITGTIFTTFIKYAVTRYQIIDILQLLSDLDSISFGTHLPEGAKIYEKTMHKTKRLSNLIFISYSSIIVAVILVPLIFWQFALPVDFWFTSEYSRSFDGWVGPYALQVLNSICVLFVTAMVDTIPVVIMLTINGQLKSLGCQLKNQPTYAASGRKQGLKFSFQEYMGILRACKDFEKLFSNVLFFQMAMLCCNLCASTIAVTMMTKREKFLGIMTNVILVFQLFCPCLLGNLVTVSSEELKNQLYFSNWYELDAAASKKEIMIFMQVLQKPISVSLGRIFTLNLNTFTGVINIVYKLYALTSCLMEQQEL